MSDCNISINELVGLDNGKNIENKYRGYTGGKDKFINGIFHPYIDSLFNDVNNFKEVE